MKLSYQQVLSALAHCVHIFHRTYIFTSSLHCTMAGNPQKNDSENTKVIIGKLIKKADKSIIPVIFAFF